MQNIMDEQIKRVKIDLQENKYLLETSEKIIKKLKERIKKIKVDAEVFIGGSLAKGTILKKDNYDIDIFIRFNKKYSEEEIKKYMNKIFFWFKIGGFPAKIKKMHGSRDYYQIISKKSNLIIEVIPTVKINKPEEARNVTDLSYFHVKYIKNKIDKNKKLIDEILLAKSFCHAQKCYGAESYVSGFSGYCLELLVINYGSFVKFLNEVSKFHGKNVLDPAGHYKNIEELMQSVNKSKLYSPIIVIDPTFKQRNVASSLSNETFDKFKISAQAFLQNPGIEFFEPKNVAVNELKRKAKIEEGIFMAVKIATNRQEGDIAGTKMLKFSKVLTKEISKYMNINEDYFEYNGRKESVIYYVLTRKKEIIIEGPKLTYKEAVENFKKVHPVWYIEDGKVKSAGDVNLDIKKLIRDYIKKNKKQIKSMGIMRLKLI